MAQTVHIATGARTLFRNTLGRIGLTRYVHVLVEGCVSVYSSLRGFAFPRKFNWEWKLEMLLDKYESETTAFFKSHIHSGMIVVDIGAHIGFFTRLFSRRAGSRGKVIAFEADAENYDLLTKNTKNRLNVVRVPVAIGDHEGTIDFYHLEGSTGCHSTVLPETKAQKVTVPLTTLDAKLGELGVDRVDLIKMDIEGGEPLALKGMLHTLKNNQNVLLVTEFNPSAIASGNTSPTEYLHSIEELGFKLYAITKGQLLTTSSVTIMEQLSNFHRTGYINILCSRKDVV